MEQRLIKLRSFFTEKKLDAILISSPIQIAYLTDYHGFSLVEREAYLVVTNNQQYLITDARYTHEVQTACPKLQVLERSAKTTAARHLEEISKKEHIERFGFEPDIVTVAEYKQFKFKQFTLVPCFLSNLRMHKDEKEIAAITKACQIGDETFSYIQSQINAGMTEKQIALLMELFIKQQDAELSFATIVAFGKNAAIPHHHTDDTILKPGNEILLDFGVKYHNYCSDMTRTIYFKSVTKEQTKIYETVKCAQQKAIESIEIALQNKQSITLAEVDQAAREYILSQGFQSIPHGLGHGIGLEVHEAPRLSPLSKDISENGMVFSIEPGIYQPENGGVRIEDLFVIQQSHLIPLTNASKELTII